MLASLKFVQGAVASKDFQPALTHFRIAGGRVMGYNGTVALSAPIELDFTAAPKAKPFVKAIERCGSESTAIHVTTTGRLGIKSGAFKAMVECAEDTEVLDAIGPDGEDVPLGGFRPAIKALRPFVGTDASRPWAMGILLKGHSAYATNNIILAQYWVDASMPEVNLPASAVDELVRIGEDPIRVQLSEHSITFHFEGERWMRSQLYSVEWPQVDSLLDAVHEGAEYTPLEDALFDAVETVAPFVALEGRVYFREGVVSTSVEGDIGATVELPGCPDHGAYNHKFLSSLKGVAHRIDFSKHPQPCPWLGDRIRGVLLGMQDA